MRRSLLLVSCPEWLPPRRGFFLASNVTHDLKLHNRGSILVSCASAAGPGATGESPVVADTGIRAAGRGAPIPRHPRCRQVRLRPPPPRCQVLLPPVGTDSYRHVERWFLTSFPTTPAGTSNVLTRRACTGTEEAPDVISVRGFFLCVGPW